MILSLWFPNWAVQRFQNRPDALRHERDAGIANGPAERMLLLYAMAKNPLRVTAACMRAMAAGVARGMPLSEARVVVGDEVDVVEHDVAVDVERMRELAVLCRRFSPVCGVDESVRHQSPDGLLLDVAGCGHLFGDEAGLADV